MRDVACGGTSEIQRDVIGKTYGLLAVGLGRPSQDRADRAPGADAALGRLAGRRFSARDVRIWGPRAP